MMVETLYVKKPINSGTICAVIPNSSAYKSFQRLKMPKRSTGTRMDGADGPPPPPVMPSTLLDSSRRYSRLKHTPAPKLPKPQAAHTRLRFVCKRWATTLASVCTERIYVPTGVRWLSKDAARKMPWHNDLTHEDPLRRLDCKRTNRPAYRARWRIHHRLHRCVWARMGSHTW